MASEKFSLETVEQIGRLSKDGVLVFDMARGSVVYANPSLAKVLEKPQELIVDGGMEMLTGVLKDERGFLEAAFTRFRKESSITNLELRLGVSKDKTVSVDAYFIEKPGLVVAFVKDVTVLREHTNYIVEFGARKDTLLDSIAMRLSGPLNLTNTLLDVLDQVSSSQRYKKIEQPAHLIRENTQKCIEIIHSLLRQEHIASPKVPTTSNRFDALAKVRTVTELYAEYNPTKSIEIVCAEKEIFATGDDVKFFQVVNNLVSNAVKFTHEDGKISVEVVDAGSFLVVNVVDDGIGIPDYLYPHLFSKGTPAARPGLRGETSTGLGLYITAKLVAMMKGTITFESEEGRGTIFTVMVPKAELLTQSSPLEVRRNS